MPGEIGISSSKLFIQWKKAIRIVEKDIKIVFFRELRQPGYAVARKGAPPGVLIGGNGIEKFRPGSFRKMLLQMFYRKAFVIHRKRKDFCSPALQGAPGIGIAGSVHSHQVPGLEKSLAEKIEAELAPRNEQNLLLRNLGRANPVPLHPFQDPGSQGAYPPAASVAQKTIAHFSDPLLGSISKSLQGKKGRMWLPRRKRDCLMLQPEPDVLDKRG